MKKTILVITGLTSLFLFGCKKQDQSTSDPDTGTCTQAINTKSIPGTYIIAYDPNVLNGRTMSAQGLEVKTEALLEQHEIPAERMEVVFMGQPGGFIAKLTTEEALELSLDVSIAAVEPDRVIKLAICFTVAEPRLITWNINRVGYGNGIGKTAWIIDTGIDFDHPDLNVDTIRSRSFISGLTSADDQNGHGTHVAGIIAGKNNTFGVLGVASGATLISLRVLDEEGSGTLSGVIQALSYVANNAKAGDVVNMSLGEDASSLILINQVEYAASKGVYIAIAAGNDNKAANLYSPGNTNAPNVYTVSAIDSLDRFASFSNFGNDVVDYALPGVRILSTYFRGRYAYMSGTSMAAPHMAGLLLLKGTAIVTDGFAMNDPDGTPDPIAHK